MARVNIDGKVWKDPRVRRLARRRKWSMRETVGTLAAVWDVAYDNKTPAMASIDVDTAAESDGFADDMVSEQLADVSDVGVVRLRGVDERIHYLIAQAERGRRGGNARMANAERTDGGRLANAKQTPSACQANAKHIPALPLTLDPDPPLTLDLDLALDSSASAAPIAAGLPTKPRRERKSPVARMPEGWKPNAKAIEKSRDLKIDVNAEADRFRDHHTAKGSAFADWDAAFRTWLGNAQRFGLHRTNQRESPTQTAMAMVREAEEREARAKGDAYPFPFDVPHAAEVAP